MTKSLLRRETNNPDTLSTQSSRELAATDTPVSAHRAGDSGVGRPIPICNIVDTSSFVVPKQTKDSKSFNNENDNFLTDKFFLPSGFCKILRGFFLFVAAIIAFLLITQTTAFLADVRQLSLLEQICLSIPLILFGGIILWIICKIFLLVWRLKVSPQIKIKALQELEDRKLLRKQCLQKNRKAVEKVCYYLQEKSLCNVDFLRSIGVADEAVAELVKNRDALVKSANTPQGTSHDWLLCCKRDFQDKLDLIANKRIMKYSVNAAIMTGVSPFSIIDRLIVLSASLAMLKELLQIYSLKPSWDKNLILMAQVIMNTYLSGILGDLAEGGIDSIAEMTEETAAQIPGIAFKFAGKTTETALQGYMVYRLGKSAIKVLHAVE